MICSFDPRQLGSSRSKPMKKIQAAMLTVLVAGLACSLPVAAQSGAPSGVLEYYWPDHQKSLKFKAKSHAFRGSLQLQAGDEVKIGEHTYRELHLTAQRLKPTENTWYLRAGEQGLYLRYSKDEKSPEILELKLPAQVGDQWQTVDRQGKPTKRSVEKIGNCQVRGKDFAKCITIIYEAREMPAIAVYAPGYGEVVNSKVNGFVYRELNTQSP